jgi:hypothetical protein
MNGRIINFELLHIDESLRYKIIMDQLLQAKADGINCVFGLMLMDGFLYRNPEVFPVDIDIVLIPGMCDNPDASTLYIEYTHRMVYNSFKNTKTPHWNCDVGNFLFLGGVPSRSNRIKLLSKFYERGLLSQAVWSFFAPWTSNDKQWCRQSLAHYSDTEYTTFVNQCERSIDSRYQSAKNYSKVSINEWDEQKLEEEPWINNIGWIDPSVFSDTLFSIISEGNAYPPATDYKFLTEKTWRTVFMRHPFVFAGYPEQFDYAKSMGLRMFEEYMLIPDYAHIKDEELRLEAVVNNTEYFLKNYQMNKSAIEKDIEHNYEVAMQLAEDQNQLLKTIQETYNIKSQEIDYWFNQPGFAHLVKADYGI